jgi:hypothetical protein
LSEERKDQSQIPAYRNRDQSTVIEKRDQHEHDDWDVEVLWPFQSLIKLFGLLVVVGLERKNGNEEENQ